MTGGAYMHPDEGDTNWMNGPVNCRDHNTAVFFPKGKDESRPRGVYDKAITICQGCEAQQQCLDYALRTNQTDGVWGGKAPDQRKRMRGAYMAANRTCADCNTPIPNRGGNVRRCDPCAFTRLRQRQYEHARRKRLESPPR